MIRPTLQQYLKPALLGRMTVLPFYPLSPEVMQMITEMKLRKVARLLDASHGMTLTVETQARDALADLCTDAESGARNVDRVIDQNVMPRISQVILERLASGDLPQGLVIGVDGEDELTFSFSDA